MEAGAAGDLPPGSRAVFVGRAHYGCPVTVLPPKGGGLDSKVPPSPFPPRPPLGTAVTVACSQPFDTKTVQYWFDACALGIAGSTLA